MDEVRYIHFREPETYITKRGKVDARYKVRGGLTVAYETEGNKLRIAIAKCNRKDVFNKKIGRDTARERLIQFNDPQFVYEAHRAPSLTFRQQITAILADQFFTEF